MEKYEVKDRLFYDGYELNQEDLASEGFVSGFLEKVNRTVFNGKGEETIIPYFDGKIKMEGGVSGIILGEGFHFTCHTFCYKNTVFIDYYGDDEKKEMTLFAIREAFKTDNYDLGSKDKIGNFGKHIIFETIPVQFSDAKNKIEKILKDIGMTAISGLKIVMENDENFDILQPIAESHISFHQHDGKLNVDIFSCKDYDEEKALRLFSVCDNVIRVNRGLRYK